MSRLNMHSFPALVSLSIAASHLAGCDGGFAADDRHGKALAVSCAGTEGQAGMLFVFRDGTSLQSRVERNIRADGSESLRGETTLPDPQGKGVTRILEAVEIGADGRLRYADVSAVGPNGATLRRMLLDPARGAVLLQDGRGAFWHHVATDAPWLYAGLLDGADVGALPLTVVSAWVALRATEGGQGARVIDGARRFSQLAMRDQLVVAEEAGERVVVLDGGIATGNAEFVTSVQRAAPDRSLAHVERPRVRAVAHL
jgi:hypothetical protein